MQDGALITRPLNAIENELQTYLKNKAGISIAVLTAFSPG